MKKLIALVAFSVSSCCLTSCDDGSRAVAAQAATTNTVLQTTTTYVGQPIVYPKTDKPEVTITRSEIPPGAETGWHEHPMPSYGYVLSGALTIETKDGRTYHYEKGQAFAETVGVAHNGKNNSSEQLTIIGVWTGEHGMPRTVPVGNIR